MALALPCAAPSIALGRALMTTDVLDGEPRGFIARVRGIMVRPQSEWQRVATEERASLLGTYVAPLAIAGAIVGLAASFAYSRFALNPALAWKGIAAALYVVFAIVGVLIAGAVINFLIRRFGGEGDGWRAKQLAVYASTPILIAAFGAIAPPVAAILLGAGVIYAFILLAIGVPRLMPLPDPENNVPRFTLAFGAASLGIVALAAAFIGPLVNTGREALLGAVQAIVPAPPIPEVERRSAAELAIDRLAQSDGARVLVDPARLGEQFPESLPSGLARHSVATAQGGGVSRADAVYRRDGAELSVSIIQFATNVDPAGAAALFDIKPDAQQEDGYARTQAIDGRLFSEEIAGEAARYIVIGRGVAMIASGNVTMDQARAAIETIDLQRLEASFSG